MPVDTARPDDLLPLPEAAALVDRSLSSLRAWLRAGRLVKHRERPEDSGSRVLVSRAELLALAAGELAASPGRPAPGVPRSVAPEHTTRAELEATRALLAVTREHLDELRRGHAQALALARDLVEAERARGEGLARELEAARAELQGARAELDALRAASGLPWWRRLLGGPPRLGDGET